MNELSLMINFYILLPNYRKNIEIIKYFYGDKIPLLEENKNYIVIIYGNNPNKNITHCTIFYY
jgi:hypothetical protein